METIKQNIIDTFNAKREIYFRVFEGLAVEATKEGNPATTNQIAKIIMGRLVSEEGIANFEENGSFDIYEMVSELQSVIAPKHYAFEMDQSAKELRDYDRNRSYRNRNIKTYSRF